MRYAICGEGPTDQVLRYLIDAEVAELGYLPEYVPSDLGRGPKTPTLTARFRRTIQLTDPDILFVHRDADNDAPGARRSELTEAATELALAMPVVPIVPVRMTEAWFLLDERAIRRAADDPNGSAALDVPSPSRAARDPDPKATLVRLVTAAAPQRGSRRRRRIPTAGQALRDVARNTTALGGVRSLPAHRRFVEELEAALAQLQR